MSSTRFHNHTTQQAILEHSYLTGVIYLSEPEFV
jgi:hypothetical protein